MIEIHDRALEELWSAYRWYRSRSKRAAERFVDNLSQALMRLRRNPAAQPVIGRSFRYVRVFKFPFVVVYRVRAEKDILVVAVAHTSRRWGYWKRRN